MAVAFGDAVMLKGGLVLELRLERARTTKDVDLRLAGSSKDILDRLRAAGALDLGDFMQFEVAPDPDTPEIVGDGVQYDGYRFRAECRLAAKLYGARFGVDIDELPWRTLAEVEAVARTFLDPVLSSERDGRWNPSSWSWTA
jgi:hypothetical protein